jgi:hypothetical protein
MSRPFDISLPVGVYRGNCAEDDGKSRPLQSGQAINNSAACTRRLYRRVSALNDGRRVVCSTGDKKGSSPGADVIN